MPDEHDEFEESPCIDCQAEEGDRQWDEFQESLPPGVDSVEEFERLGLNK